MLTLGVSSDYCPLLLLKKNLSPRTSVPPECWVTWAPGLHRLLHGFWWNKFWGLYLLSLSELWQHFCIMLTPPHQCCLGLWLTGSTKRYDLNILDTDLLMAYANAKRGQVNLFRMTFETAHEWVGSSDLDPCTLAHCFRDLPSLFKKTEAPNWKQNWHHQSPRVHL